MKLEEFGVGKITKQNTTVDVKPGETERQAKKLGLLTGKTKLLHKTAAKNSTPNKLFNLGITEDIEDSANDWLSMMFDNKDIDTILNAPKEFKQAPSTSKIYRAIFKDRNVQKENAKSTAKFIPYSTSTAGAHTYVDMSDNPGPYVIVEKQFNPNDMLVNFQSIVEHYDLLIPQNWEDEVWMQRTPYLTQSSKSEIVFDSEGNESLTEGYGKDVDEKFVTDTIKHFAKKYGINEKIALAVWQSEGGMNWQSKLKPKSKKVKTDGGQEASYGPFQLYTGKGGLGSAWEKLTGKKLSSSTSKKDIASQIDFALKTVPKRGWQDFKGANRVGINQYDGVPTKNNPMYNKMPIPKPADVKNKSMYNKVDNIKTQPSILDPRPLVKTISKGAQDAYNKTAKELGNIEVDKDSFTYKNVVKPASKAYDYISKGFTGFMKDIKKSPEYKAAGERNKKLYGPKNTVKEITVTELVVPVNDTQHAIERLKVAAELCSKMGNQPILYRAMHTGTYQGGAKQNLIQKVDNPPRKGVMGNFNPIQKAVLEDLNIVSPAQATTVAPGSTSSYFGTNHIMIPGGDFTAYWNPDIDDLGGFVGYDPKYAQGAGEGGGTVSRRDKPPSEEMQKILSGYQKGIPSYSQHKGEVILDTPFYYILNLQSFLSTFGGKKVKELITVQNKSTFSPISAELLASKFKTYSDIGWYLANPATNMLKWIASKEKIKSQESVKELKINKPDTKDTLGKLRKDMPQIKKQDYEEFMDYLKSNGAKFRKETVPASELKAMQSEFSDKGIIKQLEKNIDQGINSKAIIISDDDYVLDGHHRWIVAMNTGNDLDVYRINIPAHKLFDLTKGFEKTYYKGMYETPGTINVPMASGLTISLFPHRPLKIKKPTKGKLNYNEDVNTQRGRLEYYLKQPSIKKGMAIHLGKLPKYHNGIDELAKIVPERKGIYALNPDAWESTFYSLTNKDFKKITRYKPAIVKIPQGSIVADMAIANKFYRTNDEDEKQKLAQAYQDSIVEYGSDTSHIKMPEIIMPRLVESLEVNEAFNNPYPIDWDGSDDPESDRWIGNSILADGSLLTLEIMEVDPGEFQIDFYRKDKTNVDTMKATGQGDEFRVFATVQKGILEWWESIDQDEVHRIEFSASKESDDSERRHKLYARFAKQWANKIGWVATTGQYWGQTNSVHFVLMRPNAAKFAKDQDLEVMEDLRDWFKQKWVNIGKKKKGGGYADCGTSGDKKGYAKCVPAKKAASMTKKEKESAVRRKRSAQNKKGRGGKKKAGSGKKPIRVKTKKESMYESISYTKPKFDVEWEEANRYPYLEKLGQEGWEELANTGKVITLTTDSVKKIGNTGADGSESLDDLEPAKVARLKNAMTRGAIEMPIVVKQPDGSFNLVAGNTRLIGLISTQGEAKVWLIDASELSEEAPPGREKQVRKLKKKFDDPGAPYAIAWAQHNKHGKPKKESVNEDKVYDILLDNIGAGPFDGGCVVVAQALQKIHGGELMALVRNDGIADHAVVQVGETMYDYDGPGTVKEVVERFEKNEGARIDSVRKLRMTDLPDAPRSDELAKQIASEMKPVKEVKIEEGINDPHIFKAVFMAGGPGSGKSFVAKNLLGGTGLRPVNSDEVYEFLLKRQGLTLGPDDIASDKGQEIRGTAKDLTDKRQNNYIDGRLGLIIDGTGKVPELIQKLATQLKSIGYSVSMIFVNTSLEVAQQRNLERERTLPKDIVANSWDEVQQNLMKYQQIFGADRFHIIDNSGGLEDLDRTKNFDKVYNEVQRFINTPPKHQKALEWIQNQKAQNNARQTTDSGKSDGGVTSTN